MDLSSHERLTLMWVLKSCIESKQKSIKIFEKSESKYSLILEDLKTEVKEMQQLYEKLDIYM